ncbi:hypothetical protein A9Q74_07135 [Colwellia sp. 39_35_sub15_T18]|nr:hypothetical protein A9Q74_07135 [Colwellia sp. 39_35_sub15_T18]
MTSTLLLSFLTPKRLTVTAFAAMSILLAGCNGHSSDIPDDDINAEAGKIVQVDVTAFTGQSAELALFYPDDQLSNIQWQQTSGATVTLLTKNSKVIAFTPQAAGNYRFEVSFSVNNGTSQTLSHTITVNEQSNKIAIRLAHTVLSDNKVSLRVFTQPDIDESSIRWQQTSGPEVSLNQNSSVSGNTDGELAIFFTAPNVNKDTLLTFETTANGTNQDYSDQIIVLVEPASSIASNAYFDERVAQVFPYNSNSPYANNLVDCVYSNTLSSSCTLAKLPLLAQENTTPTINNIMDRVVVSHQWMADRFKDFLTNSDTNNDFKHLLRATTAIVISYDIRPSFYWAATGAIYLDAENFWLTANERDTINEAPDFRADFGQELQFLMPWRYVKDNDYADGYFAIEQRVTRTTNDGFYRLASLLYHELAHANDFFPSSEWFIHNDQSRILDAALSTNFESDSLAVAFPLQSSEMRSLAQVSFAGESATATEKSYSTRDIEAFFSPDLATGFYAYSSEREDYALLFEELLMQARFNVFRDVAITNLPSGDDISATDYMVTWGQRGRIGEESIKQRVAYSASRVLPEFDSTQALTQVAAPIAMISGDNWLDNLTISPITNALTASKKRKTLNELAAEQQRPVSGWYYHKGLPEQ